MSSWSKTREELGEERIDDLEVLDLVGLLDETEELDEDDVPTEEVPRPTPSPVDDEPTIPTIVPL